MTYPATSPGAGLKSLARMRGAVALSWVLLSCLPPPAGAADAAAVKSPAQVLIEHGVLAVRTEPEASKRDADSALELLKRTPDPDLEVRAHILLCDYQSERDSAAAQREITAATALLPHVRRQALRAGVLDCQGAIFETAGDNAKAMVQYQEAVSIASREHDDEMLAQSLFSRGYLLGVQGDYATGLSELRHADALFEKIKKPLHAQTTLNSIAILDNRMGDYSQARPIYAPALK